MRATEIIRGVLDLIDQVESGSELKLDLPAETQKSLPPTQDSAEEIARYKQIVDLLPSFEETEYVNTANEKYADIDAVLASGTDLLKSKNPSDIRGDHVSMYPFFQYDPQKE